MVKCTRFGKIQRSKYPLAIFEVTCKDCGEGKIYYVNLRDIIGRDLREHN